MDTVFGQQNFRTDITWKRTSAHSDTRQGRRQHGRVHDTILFYTKTSNWTWNPTYTQYDQEYVDQSYRYEEPDTGRRYRLDNLTGPGGAAKGNPSYEVMGVTRYWRYSKERMQELIDAGRIVQTRPGAVPAYKRYLDEMPGIPLQDIWTDIGAVASQAKERLGYPTQKPEALLERIIRASSNEGDVVLDPFCGCGTAVAAAHKLGRQWLGIDITHLAVALMKNRLKTAFALDAGRDYAVVGEPQDEGSARALWEQDPYQFQFWAVSLLQAQPQSEQKRGPDRGVDGMLYFLDGPRRTPQKAVIQVKGGRVSSPPNPRPQRRSRTGAGRPRTVHIPRTAHPGYAPRSRRRRFLPLRPMGPRFPQNPATHHRRNALRPKLRPAPPPRQLPARPTRPPPPRPPTKTRPTRLAAAKSTLCHPEQPFCHPEQSEGPHRSSQDS